MKWHSLLSRAKYFSDFLLYFAETFHKSYKRELLTLDPEIAVGNRVLIVFYFVNPNKGTLSNKFYSIRTKLNFAAVDGKYKIDKWFYCLTRGN